MVEHRQIKHIKIFADEDYDLQNFAIYCVNRAKDISEEAIIP
jgi:hypothetical protein